MAVKIERYPGVGQGMVSFLLIKAYFYVSVIKDGCNEA